MTQFILPLLLSVLEPATLTTAVDPIATPTPVAQAAPIDVGRDSTKSFAFDWNGNHADGSPGAEVAEVEFQYSPPAGGGQQRWVKLPLAAIAGENRVTVKEALVGIPAGTYDLQVRLLDPGGQQSTIRDLRLYKLH